MVEQNCRCGINFNFKNNDPSHGHLFVRFKCQAMVLTKDGYVSCSPGDYIFYNRNEEVGYYSQGGSYLLHDYFRFYTDEDGEDLGKIPTSKLFKAPLPSKLEDLLRLITVEFYSESKNKNAALGLLCKLFLMGAEELLEDTDAQHLKIREDILALRIEMLCSPEKDWSVGLLAEKAILSPSYFQALYKKAFGISPLKDLIDARIKKAEVYLLASDKKETEISGLCGYKNVEHFLRQFKKSKGITPSQFRKNNINYK